MRGRRTRPAQRLPRQAAFKSAGRRRAPRQSAPAAADGTAEPVLGNSIWKKASSTRRASFTHRHHRPAASAFVQSREGHRVPRHRGYAWLLLRQFRFDARPPDHCCRDVRGHSCAHARALRRQGRNPGVHHARVERRAIARTLAHGRQARQSRQAQRPAPYHLQIGGRALATGAQESRPDDARGSPERKIPSTAKRSIGRTSVCWRAPSSEKS